MEQTAKSSSQSARGHTGKKGGDDPAKVTAVVLMAAVVSAVSALLYGYDTGIISGALLQITKDFGIGSGWEQVVTASILVGAVFGALIGSQLSERLGRHRTTLIVASVYVLGALACSVSPSPVTLSASRVLLGFAVGGATQIVPMYVAELAPAKHRGRLVLTFQVGIGVGIVVSTLVGASEHFPWRVMIGMAAVPAFLMLLLMLRLPESPRWLVSRGEHDTALDVLRRIRPEGADVDEELREIEEIQEKESEAGERNRGWRGLRQPWVRPALLVGCGIAMFTQLSGIEMIVYYAPTILTTNGFSTHAALLVSVGLGVTYLVMMVVGLSIVDWVGRRRLTLTMVPGAAASLAVLGVLFVTGNDGRGATPFIIACLIVFMFFNAGGLQLMGWLTGSEIYPLAVRGAGTSIQSATLWSTNVLITLTLLTIINHVGVGQTMWLYAAFNVGAWIFVWRRMPELTGRSLEQIEAQLGDGKFLPKDFAKLSAQPDDSTATAAA
jgi:sugar porter (SP) family MFS transporter